MSLLDQLSLALPEVILAVGLLLLVVVGALRGEKGLPVVSAGAVVILLAAAVAAAWAPAGVAFAGSFTSDAFAGFARAAIYATTAVVAWLGDGWLRRMNNPRFEYPLLLLLAALGMGMMATASDLIALYVGFELQSLALYVLCAFQRDDAKSSEAGLKFFVLGALSSGLLLFGASLIYGYAGATDFATIAAAVREGAGQGGVLFGLVFVICALAFKVSAAPFHMWTPDVYEGGPTPIVAFVGTASKYATMILFARVLYESFPGAIREWSQVVTAIAVITLTWGALGGLVQRNLKRLMAYSAITNMGYGLIALSTGTEQGLQGLLIFMVLYSIDTLGVFACLMALSRQDRPMETIGDLSGLAKVKPGVAIALTLLMFSLMGIPPLTGFWAKIYALRAAFDAGLGPLAIYGLVASVVAAFYYLRIVKVMWFDPAPAEADPSPFETRAVAFASALFCLPVVLLALTALDPLARVGASALGLR